MTAVLALESGRLNDSVVVSRSAARTSPTKLHLQPGDRARLRDLTYAILLKSANDASVAVAEAIGGSVRGFAARMNRRAAELGARNTRFVNPNGLPAGRHHSTASDLAQIFRHALHVPGFRDIAGSSRSRVRTWRRNRRRSVLVRNGNRLLSGYRVPVLGKTGYTRAAKRCFVGAAHANGKEIVIALLGSTDLWGDARKLLDFGLAQTLAVPEPVAAEAPRAAYSNPDRELGHATPDAVDRRLSRLNAGGLEGRAEDGEYTIVLTPSHNSRAAAERLRHFVDRRGHRAIIESVGPARGRQYRVRVRGLPTRGAALRAAAALRAQHLRPTLVPPG
jgi:D-alanyl-D-alanine carboxypeptidase